MKKTILMLCITCLNCGMASSALAQTRSEHNLLGHSPLSQSEIWLRLQREGQQASPHIQQPSLKEKEQSFQRWLNSYQHPIPERFEQNQGGSFGQK